MAKPVVPGSSSTPQSIYEASTKQHFPIGTRGILEDRVFYYASHEGAGFGVSQLCAPPAPVGDHTSVAYASGGAANAKTVTVTLGSTAATANQYAEGYLIGIDGTGSGQIRKIRSHPAAESAATLELTLYDAIQTAFAAGAELSLVLSPYKQVTQHGGMAATGVELIPLGVNPVIVPAGSTDPQYFWLQTWGPALVQGDGAAFTAGAPVIPAAATADAGQVTLQDATAEITVPTVGHIQSLGDATSDLDFRFVRLMLNP